MLQYIASRIISRPLHRTRYGLLITSLSPSSSNSKSYHNRYYSSTCISGATSRCGYSSLFALLGCTLLSYFIKKKREETVYCISSDGKDTSNDSRSKRFNFLAETVEKASPCVVLIEVNKLYGERRSLLFNQTMPTSNGSGFIIEDGKYVLTNAHVVGSAHSVTVKLQDGRKLSGIVTDLDEIYDLALVKLDLSANMPCPPSLKFGCSSKVRPGEWVVALGSPLTLSNTITSGIVSSVHRHASEIPDPNLQHSRPHMEYIQTDAAITFGNSGGPLVNLDGEVIGINTMTAGPGISFAVPSDFAKRFLESASRTVKRVSKYGIGISMMTITPSISHYIQQHYTSFLVNNGVLLAGVWRGSPADMAGLRKRDIIISMNSLPVTSTDEIYKAVQKGKELVFEVIRGNEKRRITVKPEPL